MRTDVGASALTHGLMPSLRSVLILMQHDVPDLYYDTMLHPHPTSSINWVN